MNTPLVSVVIPFYNRRNFITETVGSVQAQTFTNWEVVIVDDGSTDGSYEFIVDAFSGDSRVRIFQREDPPKGANRCRNMGARIARGKYVIFLDSDDLLAPNCLERRVSCFEENPDCDFLVFTTLVFTETTDNGLLWNVDTDESDLLRFLRQDVVWPIIGPIHKRESLLARNNLFDEALPFWQDFEFHVRYLFKKPKYRKFLSLDPDHYCRRHRSDSISQKSYGSDVKKVQKIKERILDDIYTLVQAETANRKEYKDNLAYNYIMICEDAFRHKLILFSYGIFTRLWLKGFFTFADYVYLLVKQPLVILKIKNPKNNFLERWQKKMRARISEKIMFPKHQILQVQYNRQMAADTSQK